MILRKSDTGLPLITEHLLLPRMDQSERFVQKMNDGAANASDEGGGVSVPNESVSFTNNDPVPVKKKKNKKKRKPSKKVRSSIGTILGSVC